LETNDRAISYDQVPYNSMPFRATHPATLAVIAAFAGFAATPPADSRILEIGCASGGNLLPMAAAHPQAQFVGIDLGSRHIADATALAQAAAIRNVRFHCHDLRTFKPDGPFDYIIAHGLYSWIPADARDRLLALAGEYLAPRGVAFISYMVYPGAYVYEALRHAIQVTTRTTPMTDLPAAARKITTILSELAPKLAPRWGPVLAKWGKDMCGGPDFSLLHDQLEAVYHPVYFTNFLQHAAASGLRYLGDVSAENTSAAAAPMRRQIEQMTDDALAPIQLLDIAGFRMFRQSILARADARIEPPDPLAVIARAHVASDKNLPPQGPAPKQPAPKPDPFLHDPLAQAVLAVLSRRWPRTMPVAELTRQADIAARAADSQAIARCVMSLHNARHVELWIHEPTYLDDGADPARATITQLARVQAATGKAITNLRHHPFDGDDPEARRIIALIDGTQSAPELTQFIPHLARNSMLFTRPG
jgi:hypothetical protein